MSASLGSTSYSSVVWTGGDLITEAKLDAMVANDQAYDAHASQGYLVDNSKSFAGKLAGGSNANIARINSSDELELGDSALAGVLLKANILLEPEPEPSSPTVGKFRIFLDETDDELKMKDGAGNTGHLSVPIGGIIMWYGSIATIPDGYSLCDGSNGTPDLRGKFIVGAQSDSGGDNASTYDVGDTGGENRHTLTNAEIPEHTHYYTDKYTNGNRVSGSHGWNATSDKDPAYNEDTKSTQPSGSGDSHENRPPYYALAYIMRIF